MGVKPILREARPDDAGAISVLIAQLGFDAGAERLSERIVQFTSRNESVLIVETKRIVGCVTWHIMQVIHRETAVGRITMLVVDKSVRGRGLGALLVAEVENRVIAQGCGLIEVTSNDRLVGAHAFYENLGYEKTSVRFGKKLAP